MQEGAANVAMLEVAGLALSSVALTARLLLNCDLHYRSVFPA